MSEVRLDKYLWAVRVFKTRSDAADAIRNNRVMVNDAYAKPSREVKQGDIISVKRMPVTYRYKVLELVSSRQGAKNVPQYCLNITPQEELDKLLTPRRTLARCGVLLLATDILAKSLPHHHLHSTIG